MGSETPDQAGQAETLGSLLRHTQEHLHQAGMENPGLEAELLLRQALRSEDGGLPSKAWLLQRLNEPASDAMRRAVEALEGRRAAHEPSAYITGTREFWGLDFEVSPDVLIPRPETELLVETALSHLRQTRARLSPQHEARVRWVPTVVDVGTGSGAIAVAIARELPTAGVIATDVSRAALAVARRNARRHGIERRISFRHGDLLLRIDSYVDLIVANLPYVRDDDWRALEPEVRDHEPRLALAAGNDGLDLIRSLLHQARHFLRPGGAVCLEFGAGQHDAVMESARACLPGADIEVYEDFGSIPRVIVAALQGQ